jgi:hypothetical protein
MTANYSIRYNRATNHIAGIACKTTSNQTDEDINRTGVVAYYAENACGVLTRGRLAQGASYEGLEEALDAARKTGGRKICKTCEKAALAAIEAAANAPVEEPKAEVVEGAEHQVGDKLYFLPGERPHGYVCPAGEVEVVRVVDHGEFPRFGAQRFTYVVQVPGIPATSQGTDRTELHAPGSVPVDYRFPETYDKAICARCKGSVTYANTKIVSEPIPGNHGPTYYGIATRREFRVCAVDCR